MLSFVKRPFTQTAFSPMSVYTKIMHAFLVSFTLSTFSPSQPLRFMHLTNLVDLQAVKHEIPRYVI